MDNKTTDGRITDDGQYMDARWMDGWTMERITDANTYGWMTDIRTMDGQMTDDGWMGNGRTDGRWMDDDRQNQRSETKLLDNFFKGISNSI